MFDIILVVLFVLVLTLDFLVALNSKKTPAFDVVLRAAMIICFGYFVRIWF